MTSKILSVLTVIAASAAIGTSVWADGDKASKREMVGTVSVKWKDDGEAGAITFTSFENDNETQFTVKPSKASMALAELDGRRVALDGSFSAGGANNTVSIDKFYVTVSGYLRTPDTGDTDEEDEEIDEDPSPIAYLEVAGGEDGDDVLKIIDDATSRKMLKEAMDQRVEVIATLDDENHLRVRSYNRVLTGTVKMQASPVAGSDDGEAPLLPHFVCHETGKTHAIVQNELCKVLQKDCLSARIEVIASLAQSGDKPAITVQRFATLHTGEIKVDEDDDGNVTAVRLVVPGAASGSLQIALSGRGEELAHYDGQSVTLTGCVRVEGGVRRLVVRSIRS